MTSPTNCNLGSLEPFVPSEMDPWNRQKIKHLYRRLGFGANNETISAVISKDPLEAVDNIIDTALNYEPLPEPVWAYWRQRDYTSENIFEEFNEHYVAFSQLWIRDMLSSDLRGKLTLFWSNHFVTQIDVYNCSSYMYQYYQVLEEHALGNFKDFVHAIGLTPAMLVYLNGVQNANLNPNENYARELYELFTLGRDNGYDQSDIVETARALSGFVGRLEFCGPIGFLDIYWDKGEKTIFGQTGNWGYDEVIDLLFQHRTGQVAKYICQKIYSYFVHPEPNVEIIEAMAKTFINNGFELAPVLRQLFKSEHFFHPSIMSIRIKSPLEWFLTFTKETGFEPNDEIVNAYFYFSFTLGQQLFNPVDVAGWPGNKSWIDNSKLTFRWQGLNALLGYVYQNAPDLFSELALKIVGESSDAGQTVRTLTDFFVPAGLQSEADYQVATDVFKANIPSNYFDSGAWNLYWDTVPGQVALLLSHLQKLPEFQLN